MDMYHQKTVFCTREQCMLFTGFTLFGRSKSYIWKQAEPARNTDLYTENISIQ